MVNPIQPASGLIAYMDYTFKDTMTADDNFTLKSLFTDKDITAGSVDFSYLVRNQNPFGSETIGVSLASFITTNHIPHISSYTGRNKGRLASVATTPKGKEVYVNIDKLAMIEWSEELEVDTIEWEAVEDDDGIRVYNQNVRLVSDSYKSKYMPALITHFSVKDPVGAKNDPERNVNIVAVTLVPYLTPNLYRKAYNQLVVDLNAGGIPHTPLRTINKDIIIDIDENVDSIYFRHNKVTGKYDYIGSDIPLYWILSEGQEHDTTGMPSTKTSGIAVVFRSETERIYRGINSIHRSPFETQTLPKDKLKSDYYPVTLHRINSRSDTDFQKSKKIWEEWAGFEFEEKPT